MEQKKVILSKEITPVTKRIGIWCLTSLALASIAGACFGKIDIKDALLIIIPVMTSISAMVDGGK